MKSRRTSSSKPRPPRDGAPTRGRAQRQEAGPRKPGSHKTGSHKAGKREEGHRRPDTRPGARPTGIRKAERPRDAAPRPVDIRPEEKPEAPPLSASVQTVTVTPDENGMRVDRFFEARFPGLSFSHIQRIIRKGEVRVNGKRTEPKDRLEAGQSLRIPPLRLDPQKPRSESAGRDQETLEFLQSITLYDDDDVMVLNKPMGLAVQGGSGTTRHVDGMLGVIRTKDGQRPRLVHRLDKDTAGCLLIAKSRFASAALAKIFRSRSARKIY